ncbi:MAG: TIGR01906 family membrane protein [Clostridia bacterium]|nr:TIGR01906 family membrane protein [Clostridia bacterium]
MRRRPIDILFAILVILFIPVFCISAAALIPCVFRPFYYVSMDLLKIPETSGYSPEVVREAYDDVMDYIWFGGPFCTGELAFSPDGEAHFADCVPLFRLQPILFGVSLFVILLYAFLRRKEILRPLSFRFPSPLTLGGGLSAASIFAVGIFALVDFGTLFKVFHMIAFPGKDNWLFDPATDEIIKILPESFFLVCAVFIVGVALLLSGAAILAGILRRRR